MEDWEKSILNASEFCEMTLAVVKNIVDKEVINVNNTHFDQLCNEPINRTKVTAEDEILMLAIPTAARPHMHRHEKVDDEDTHSPRLLHHAHRFAGTTQHATDVIYSNMKSDLQQHRRCFTTT